MKIRRRVDRLTAKLMVNKGREYKPFTPKDWTDAELDTMIKNFDTPPLKLKKKYNLTKWSDRTGELTDRELQELEGYIK